MVILILFIDILDVVINMFEFIVLWFIFMEMVYVEKDFVIDM